MTSILNHDDLSAWLDHYAATYPNKTPLTRDERLWDLFAEDRAQHVGFCGECKRPMRSWRAKSSDAPGTVPQAREGQCVNCYKRARREPSRAKRPERCAQCNRRMRSSRERLENFPGTVSHRSGDLCAGCYRPVAS